MQTIAAGATATFTITVKNTTGVKLTSVTVSEARQRPGVRARSGTDGGGQLADLYVQPRGRGWGTSRNVVLDVREDPVGLIGVGEQASASAKVEGGRPVHATAATGHRDADDPGLAVADDPDRHAQVDIGCDHAEGHLRERAVQDHGDQPGQRSATTSGSVTPSRRARAQVAKSPREPHSLRLREGRITAGFTTSPRCKNATGTSIAASTRARVKVKAGPAGPRAKTNSGVDVTKSTSGKTVTLNIPDVLFAFNQSTLGRTRRRF